MSKILFGTDPESFAVYEKDGKMYTLPPYFFRKNLGVDASNHPKHPVFIKGDEFKLHEDGAAFELSIMPSFNPKDLFDRVQAANQAASATILSRFPDHCLPELQYLPTVGFEVNRWGEMPRDFFMSTTFGCDPDEDAFNLDKKARIVDASQHPERYGGGHIHFSGNPLIADEPILAVQLLALTAGCAAVAYSDVPELEKARTFLYGRPGKYRVQKYGKNNPFGEDYANGIEYRTTSNRMFSSWNIFEKVTSWASIAINELLPRKNAYDLVAEAGDTAISAILEANQDSAKDVLSFVESIL